MEIIKKINKEITFNHNISEITSICMDIEYEQDETNLVGNLNLEGDYISSEEISMSEDFKYKLDFNFPLDAEIEDETLKVAIDDFTYDIDQDKLIINVELKINYEEAVNEDRVEFDKFLDDKEIDLQGFLDNIKISEEEKSENFEKFEEMIEEQKMPSKTMNEYLTGELGNGSANIEKNSDSVHIENSLIDISNEINEGDEYITYHIYIVNDTDTLETIANRYHINADIIKEYNEIENIKGGMKLVIPCDNE